MPLKPGNYFLKFLSLAFNFFFAQISFIRLYFLRGRLCQPQFADADDPQRKIQ